MSCDAFDNFPPGLTGKVLVTTGKLPPSLFGLFMQQMRLRFVRRLPMAFGWLTKQGDAATARWIRPVLQRSENPHRHRTGAPRYRRRQASPSRDS